MSAGVISIIFGLGAGAWIFNKTSHRTNDNRTSLITGTFVGLVAAFVIFTLLKLILPK